MADCSPSDINRVRQHMLDRGRDFFPLLSVGFHLTVQPMPISTNPLFRFSLMDDHWKFCAIAKRAPVYPDNNEGLSEFLNYREFNADCDSMSPVCCPRALAYLRDCNFLVTEEVDGVPFLRQIRIPWPFSCRSLDATLRAVRLCGQWLAQFHRMAPIRQSRLSLECARPYEQLLRNVNSRLTDMLSSKRKYEMHEWDESISGKLRNAQYSVGRVHGDFAVSNVLVSTRTVTVLDAAFRRAGPQVADLADFLLYPLFLYCCGTQSWTWFSRLKQAFLENYLSHVNSQVSAVDFTDFSMLALLRLRGRHLARLMRLPVGLRNVTAACLLNIHAKVIDVLLDSRLSAKWPEIKQSGITTLSGSSSLSRV